MVSHLQDTRFIDVQESSQMLRIITKLLIKPLASQSCTMPILDQMNPFIRKLFHEVALSALKALLFVVVIVMVQSDCMPYSLRARLEIR
jgi:hypothetical protein